MRDGEEESEAEIRGRREKEEGLGKEVVRRLGNPREGSGEETESRPIEKKSVRVRFLLSSSPVAGTWDSKMKNPIPPFYPLSPDQSGVLSLMWMFVVLSSSK